MLLRIGQYDEAIADYDAALRDRAEKAASLYGRGMAKRRKGDFAGGNADIAAARRSGPNVWPSSRATACMPPLPISCSAGAQAKAPGRAHARN